MSIFSFHASHTNTHSPREFRALYLNQHMPIAAGNLGMQTVADNLCKCGMSRSALYHLCQTGRATTCEAIDVFCSTYLEVGWRTASNPKCIFGVAIDRHPSSPSAEYRRTMGLHSAVVVSLVLLCSAFGLSQKVDAVAGTVLSSCFSLLAIVVVKPIVEVLKVLVVRWDSSRWSAAVAAIPLAISAALVTSGVYCALPALLSLSCSVGNVYLAELMSAIVAWKRQRLNRQSHDPAIDKLLHATYRAPVTLLIGAATPMVLSGLLLWIVPHDAAVMSLVIVGGLIWCVVVMYVLLELKAWEENKDNVDHDSRTPILGLVLFLTSEKSAGPQQPPTASREPTSGREPTHAVAAAQPMSPIKSLFSAARDTGSVYCETREPPAAGHVVQSDDDLGNVFFQ